MDLPYYYADPVTQRQKGPITTQELQSLLRTNVLTKHTLVWKPSFSAWIPIAEIFSQIQQTEEERQGTGTETYTISGTNSAIVTVPVSSTVSSTVVHSLAPLSSSSSSSSLSSIGSSTVMYYYADETGTQIGPVAQEAFISLLEAGYITKNTLVWTNSMENWLPIIDYPPLYLYLGQTFEKIQQPHTKNSDTIDELSRKRKRSESNDQIPLRSLANDNPSTDSNISNNRSDDGGVHSIPPKSNFAPPNIMEKDTEEDDDENVNQPEGSTLVFPNETQQNKPKKRSQKKKHRQTTTEPNTWIYITGLPLNTNEHEIVDYFRKAGMIRLADGHGNPRINLYRTTMESSEPNQLSKSVLKGDCSLCYLMPESVELAIELFDGAEYRPGYKLTVEEATPDQTDNHASQSFGKGNLDTVSSTSSISSSHPKRNANNGDIMYSGLLSSSATSNKTATLKARSLTPEEHTARIRAIEQAARLSWAEEGDETFGLRIVVIKRMFDPYDPETRLPTFEKDLIEEIQPELEAHCGTVHKIIVFPLHPDGVVLVKFKSAGAAVACLNQFTGRFFGGRSLQVELWDGHTDYRSSTIVTVVKNRTGNNTSSTMDNPLSNDEEDRLADFGKWLESGTDEI